MHRSPSERYLLSSQAERGKWFCTFISPYRQSGGAANVDRVLFVQPGRHYAIIKMASVAKIVEFVRFMQKFRARC